MSKTPPETDPREMRKALEAAAYGDAHRISSITKWGETCGSSVIVRQCLEFGRYSGWSGEDTMTMIAYQLMLRNEQLYKLVLDNANLWPSARPAPKVG